MSLKITFCSQ